MPKVIAQELVRNGIFQAARLPILFPNLPLQHVASCCNAVATCGKLLQRRCNEEFMKFQRCGKRCNKIAKEHLLHEKGDIN